MEILNKMIGDIGFVLTVGSFVSIFVVCIGLSIYLNNRDRKRVG